MVDGEEVHLPIRYHEMSFIAASFSASLERVREVIPDPSLHPVQFAPGRAVVMLTALEYRRVMENDGRERAAYNEFSTMIPVLHEPGLRPPVLPLLVPKWFRTFGVYVHHLPVTTAESRDFGIDIWGLPKTLADISFESTSSSRRCHVREGGQHVLTLEVNEVHARTQRTMDRLYGVQDGQLRRCVFEARGQVGIALFRGGASCELGDHPMATELRRMDLGHRALDRTCATWMEGLLHRPEEYRAGSWVPRHKAGPARTSELIPVLG
jgi:hypothetical protein